MSEQVTEKKVPRGEARGVQIPVQIRLLVEGEIEPAQLRVAWQKIADRSSGVNGPAPHANGNGNGRGKRVPWQEHDLRGLPKEQARKWILSFVETDGQQGISAERTPQMRCALLLTGKKECELVWSLHPALTEQIDVQQALVEFEAACQSDVPIIEMPTQRAVARELPFFFLGGDPTFRPLSQRLSRLREFHSLGLRMSLLAKLKDPDSLECIAEQFVQSIKERCPEGPYMVGGWCAHGLLAFETARQLQAQGQEVAEVLLLETVNPVRMKQYSGWKRFIARTQLKFHLLKFEYAYLQQLNSTQTRDYIAGRTAKKIARMRQSLRRVLKATKFYPELEDATAGNPLDFLYAASAKYHPKPYRGSVVLIRSTQRTFGFGHVLDLGWSELLGSNLEICETPGNHYTIYMEPNVDALAKKMDMCLRKGEEQATQASPRISQ